jgi:hypothetical protein
MQRRAPNDSGIDDTSVLHHAQVAMLATVLLSDGDTQRHVERALSARSR